jgi:hypothetical protein
MFPRPVPRRPILLLMPVFAHLSRKTSSFLLVDLPTFTYYRSMAKPTTRVLPSSDALVRLIREPHTMFDCGTDGFIVAAKGIKFQKVPLAHHPGKLVIASHNNQNIGVKIEVKKHLTTLTTKSGTGLDQKLLLRLPIGVRLFEIPLIPLGFSRAFFYQTGDGYNTLPYHLPAGEDSGGGQTVQELILITSHVPPRLDPGRVKGTDDITMLTEDELNALLKPDVPA